MTNSFTPLHGRHDEWRHLSRAVRSSATMAATPCRNASTQTAVRDEPASRMSNQYCLIVHTSFDE